jgi:hypothetical protein
MRKKILVTFLRSGMMARRQVVEIICDRCKRTETQEDKPRPQGEQPGLVITYKGKQVQFDDFCRRCDSTVENYVNKLLKKPEDDEGVSKPAASKEKKGLLSGLGRKAG